MKTGFLIQICPLFVSSQPHSWGSFTQEVFLNFPNRTSSSLLLLNAKSKWEIPVWGKQLDFIKAACFIICFQTFLPTKVCFKNRKTCYCFLFLFCNTSYFETILKFSHAIITHGRNLEPIRLDLETKLNRRL